MRSSLGSSWPKNICDSSSNTGYFETDVNYFGIESAAQKLARL